VALGRSLWAAKTKIKNSPTSPFLIFVLYFSRVQWAEKTKKFGFGFFLQPRHFSCAVGERKQKHKNK
jgi:hypothetical protein